MELSDYEVLYDRISAWRRMHLHRDIGLRKEAGYGTQSATIAAELVQHFEQAQDVTRATTYLQYAATTAAQRSAHTEAILYLRRALALLSRLEPSVMRQQQDYTLQVALGNSLCATRGWAAPEVQQTYEHAWALCQQMQVTPEHAAVLYGLCSCYLVREDLYQARAFAEKMLQLAQQYDDTDIHLEAGCMMGGVSLFLGDYLLASTYASQSLALYAPQRHQNHILVYGMDPGVIASSVASWSLWLQGDLEQSLQCSQQALALGQNLTHTLSRGYALMFAAWLALFRREEAAALSLANATIALGQDHGFPLIVAEALFIQGRALLAIGEVEKGIAGMVGGIHAYQATGAMIGFTMFLALFADGYATVGRVADGLMMVAAGLALGERTGEHWWTAELQRLRGQLLLAQTIPDAIEAEVWMRKALAMARRQQAKTLELRAATSLARLWQSQGKRTDARELLAPVYGWFTAGIDTTDLKNARALL